MRRWLTLVLACALVAGAGSALAGGSRGGHWRGGSHVSGSAHFKPGVAQHWPFFHHHRRVIIGSTIFIGALGYPYYAPAPVYVAPPEPVTYIEQPPAAQVLYYCPDARAYYPGVTTCPSPWLKVVP